MLSRFCTTLLFFVMTLTGAALAQTTTAPGARSFTEELLSSPCREGRWLAGQWSGTQAVCFKKEGDQIIASTEKTTGTPKNLDGPTKELVIDEVNRKVTFKSNRGYPYELKLVDGNILVGTAKADYSVMELKLLPQ